MQNAFNLDIEDFVSGVECESGFFSEESIQACYAEVCKKWYTKCDIRFDSPQIITNYPEFKRESTVISFEDECLICYLALQQFLMQENRNSEQRTFHLKLDGNDAGVYGRLYNSVNQEKALSSLWFVLTQVKEKPLKFVEKLRADNGETLVVVPEFCGVAHLHLELNHLGGRKNATTIKSSLNYLVPTSPELFQKEREEETCSFPQHKLEDYWYYEQMTGINLAIELSSYIDSLLNRVSDEMGELPARGVVEELLCRCMKENYPYILLSPAVKWKAAVMKNAVRDVIVDVLMEDIQPKPESRTTMSVVEILRAIEDGKILPQDELFDFAKEEIFASYMNPCFRHSVSCDIGCDLNMVETERLERYLVNPLTWLLKRRENGFIIDGDGITPNRKHSGIAKKIQYTSSMFEDLLLLLKHHSCEYAKGKAIAEEKVAEVLCSGWRSMRKSVSDNMLVFCDLEQQGKYKNVVRKLKPLGMPGRKHEEQQFQKIQRALQEAIDKVMNNNQCASL